MRAEGPAGAANGASHGALAAAGHHPRADRPSGRHAAQMHHRSDGRSDPRRVALLRRDEMNAIANLVQPGSAYVPLRLAGRPLALKAVVLVLGVAFLTASSYVQVPMLPVPMTMQTFAVLAVGAFCGWRLGLATIVA